MILMLITGEGLQVLLYNFRGWSMKCYIALCGLKSRVIPYKTA